MQQWFDTRYGCETLEIMFQVCTSLLALHLWYPVCENLRELMEEAATWLFWDPRQLNNVQAGDYMRRRKNELLQSLLSIYTGSADTNPRCSYPLSDAAQSS
jgi:hypothetical protein